MDVRLVCPHFCHAVYRHIKPPLIILFHQHNRRSVLVVDTLVIELCLYIGHNQQSEVS